MTRLNSQSGFTIIELIVASSIFAVILLLCAIAITSIGKLYYKGITSTATQEVARTVVDEIKADFELSGGYYIKVNDDGTPTGAKGFCIGSHLYSYKRSPQKIGIDGSGNVLVVRDYDSCDIAPPAGPDNVSTGNDVNGVNVSAQWRELLGPNMRLSNFTLTPPAPPLDVRPQSLAIEVNIVAGEDDLIDLVLGRCNVGSGSQFCASSPLSAYAVRRLR